MNEAMGNNKPLTPKDFVSKNLSIIRKVFPAVIGEARTPSDSLSSPLNLIASLENQVWETMGDDPVLQMLSREKYNVLPEEKRLKILEDAIHLLDAVQEADKFLNSK